MKLKFCMYFGMAALLCLQTSTILAADQGTDYPTKPFWNIDKMYRASHDMGNIVNSEAGCNDTTKYVAGVDSIFREVDENDSKSEKIISFEFIKQAEGPSPSINSLYKICSDNTKQYLYRRAGGIDKGILVVPYKVRSGDLYGDTTLGPYFALKGDLFTLLATFGMTQVTVSDMATSKVKSETGLSFALGTIWSLGDNFEIGLVAGKDHLSGAAGKNFQFQDKVWWSFAIGYNFTN
ncbi:MAG: hypothetical protein HOP24_08160 [Sideroxydans sp.]|nr:hypothetical protein [Sideroxydans sp.]